MSIIPNHILIDTYKNYLSNDIQQIKTSLSLSKHYYQHLITDFIKLLEENVLKIYPQKIIHNFGKLSKFIFYPKLEFKRNFMGDTKYLDKFTFNDLLNFKKYPIITGIDYYNRPFIILKLKLEIIKSEDSDSDSDSDDISRPNLGVVTIFQRYSDCDLSWTCGTAYYHFMDVFKCGVLDDSTFVVINTLITEKQVIHNNKRISLI